MWRRSGGCLRAKRTGSGRGRSSDGTNSPDAMSGTVDDREVHSDKAELEPLLYELEKTLLDSGCYFWVRPDSVHPSRPITTSRLRTQSGRGRYLRVGDSQSNGRLDTGG